MSGLEASLEQFGLALACVVLAFKAGGVPIPIPGDVILIAVAARAAEGRYAVGVAFAALLLAILVGGFGEFALARGPGRGVIYRFGRLLRLTPARLDAAASAVQRRGPLSLAAGIFTPGVRILTIAACGLAGLPLRTFLPGLVLGSTADLTLHFAIGYLGWPVVASLWERVPAPLLVLVGLLLVGLAVWVLIRRRQRPEAPLAEVTAEALRGWHQASCPACLAVGVLTGGELRELASPRTVGAAS
ncbi:MAG TPA: VTT domain-containing protein [Chloroflexota bacterium]